MKTTTQTTTTATLFTNDLNNVRLSDIFLNDECKNFKKGIEYNISISKKQEQKIRECKKMGDEQLNRRVIVKTNKNNDRAIIILSVS